MTKQVLIVDDDEYLRKFFTRGLSRTGLDVVPVDGGQAAIDHLQRAEVDAVVCDLAMPEVDGLDVLRQTGRNGTRPPFIMLTGFGTVSVAVEAMKHGAADFLEKPVTIEELKASILNAIEKDRSKARVPSPVTKGSKPPPSSLVGSEEWLEDFNELIRRLAMSDATVLIEGETGTGKSAVARELYRQSRRSDGPFVELNCAAFQQTLVENELFGNVKGAFTGAVGHAGKFEQAHQGTLFLDEIGELHEETQSKLLKVIQEKRFTRLGGSKEQEADVRLIAATNRSLEDEVKAGRFREDLYYRIDVVGLTIPPLRDRPGDIPILLEYFIDHVSERLKVTGPVFSPEAVALLKNYTWPGNVRELENTVERMAAMYPPGTLIEPDKLSARILNNQRAEASSDASPPPLISEVDRFATDGLPLAEVLRDYERKCIVWALKKCDGNNTRAAALLKMRRTTFLEKKRKFGIT